MFVGFGGTGCLKNVVIGLVAGIGEKSATAEIVESVVAGIVGIVPFVVGHAFVVVGDQLGGAGEHHQLA